MLAIILIAGVALVAFGFAQSAQAQEGSGDQTEMQIQNGNQRLGVDQIAQLAIDAGFGDDAALATAVALAESSGNTHAYNPETAASGGTPAGEGSYGLWQVYRKKHPEFASLDLFDPGSNAAAAYQVYVAAGHSFRPWSTFTQTNPSTGEKWYVSHIDDATNAVFALNGTQLCCMPATTECA